MAREGGEGILCTLSVSASGKRKRLVTELSEENSLTEGVEVHQERRSMVEGYFVILRHARYQAEGTL